MASDVDLRSTPSDLDPGDPGHRGDPDEPTVTYRPLDRDRWWSRAVLAVVAVAVAFAGAVERIGRRVAAASRRAAGHHLRPAVGRAAERLETAADAFGDWCRAHWPVVAAAARRNTRRAITNLDAAAESFGRWCRVQWPVLAAATRRALTDLDAAAEAFGRWARAWWAARTATAAAAADDDHHHDRRRHDPERLGDGQPLTATHVARSAATAVAIVALLVATLAVGGRKAAEAVTAGVASADPSAVALPPLAERSELFAADGSSLGVVQADHGNRVVVPLDAVPEVLVDAVLATEDADYWRHGGIDMSGVARAAKRNVAAGEVAEGGSTITQQLAKSTLTDPKRDLRRKLTEAILAVRLDDQLGKRGVLERYLNTIYFGHGAYGVATAAETYFARPVGELTADQAALLAGLIRGPNLYDPMAVPDAARARRSTVLAQMVRTGALTADERAAAEAAPLPTAVHRPPAAVGWVADAARAELLADPRLGRTPEARAAALAGGGLRVHTTVDPALQRQAEEAVAKGLPRGTELTAALASIDPATGAVRALVGGGDYGARQFNAATEGAGRQTGSSFKVFTLVAALEAGHVSSEVVDGNAPCPIPNPGGKPNPWLPENYEGEAFGPLSLVDATVHSSNCAYARLAATVGVDAVARTAAKMGIRAPLQQVPSMTLGTNTVPPVQMAAAYATLAADGIARTPHVVERVERADGSVVFANGDGGPQRALDPQVARVATAVLSEVVARGTGRAAALGGRPVAGKTGTAQNHQDAWFVGYTPQLATAVWMGDVRGERPMLGVGGINVTGGSYPARIWRQFMAAAHDALPVVGFPAPAPEPPPNAVAPAPTEPAAGARSPRPAKGKGKGKD